MLPHGLLVVLGYIVGGLIGIKLVLWAIGIVVIGSDEMGIVEKRWSRKGSVKEGQIIALDGEAGFQPAVLRTGLHLLTPIFYTVKKRKLITIGRQKIGYVFARDGKQFESGQVLGKVIDVSFENCAGWLSAGGQKGINRAILREGTYAINTAAFAVLTEGAAHYIPMGDDEVIKQTHQQLSSDDAFNPVVITGESDQCGIVTVNDGRPLINGDIIAPDVSGNTPDHRGFQDPEAFLAAGGWRGKQLQVLVEGVYFINKAFASVQLVKKTTVEVGYVDVVVSNFGATGQDLSSAEFGHGKLVSAGERGVYEVPLGPGKYALNTFAFKTSPVPTTNVVLKWQKDEAGEHGFDAKLTELELITRDGYDLRLPVSVVCHIGCDKASLVIQRFGDIHQLVNQTLDPFVSAYFKDVGQQKEAIQLLHERDQVQKEAKQAISEVFQELDLTVVQLLISTPHGVADASGNDPFAKLLEQLQLRKLAEEQVKTFQQQQTAAEQQKNLAEAQAIAQQQTLLTESNIKIERDRNQGAADLATKEMAARANVATAEGEKTAQVLRAKGEAEALSTIAAGKAKAIVLEGEATATAKAKVGIAEGIAAKQKVAAYGGSPALEVYQKIAEAFAGALREGKQQLVPNTQFIMGGGAGGGFGAGSALESLLGVFTVEKLQKIADEATVAAERGELDDYVQRLTEEVMGSAMQRPASPESPATEKTQSELDLTDEPGQGQ